MHYPLKGLFFILSFLIFSDAGAQVPYKKYENLNSASNRLILPTSETYYKQQMDFADSLLLHYRKINPDSALIWARYVKHYALLLNDTASVDYAITHIGSLHRIAGNYDSSLFYYDLALEKYKKRDFAEGIASIYNNKATVYKTQNRYDLAIKNYLEALEIFKHSKNYTARGNLYSNFAGLYFKLENYEKAKEYWQLAEADYKKAKSYEVSHSYRGYAKILIAKEKYHEAWEEVIRADASDKKFKIEVFYIEDAILLMEIYLKTGLERIFQNVRNEIRPITKNIDLPIAISRYHELSGDFYRTQSNLAKAIQQYDSSLVYLKDDDSPEATLNILKKKYNLQILTGESPQKLSAGFQAILSLEKKVAKLKNDRITQETDARYSLKDKEERIQFLNERNKVANELIESEKKLAEQSKRQILWMWLGIGLFIGFIIYVLFTNRKLKSTQKELQKNIEQKDFLFRELNHRVKNNLHIVSSFLSIESHGKTEEVKEILLTCENRIHSLGLVHEMLYKGEISESIELDLYFGKLVQVIRETLINDQTEIKTDIESGLKLHSNKVVLLGLIANELITNAIKYAKSPERSLVINLAIQTVNGKTQMLISDNGIGFNETGNKKNSLGMKLAKGLTGQLNGEFSYENKVEGVEFRVGF